MPFHPPAVASWKSRTTEINTCALIDNVQSGGATKLAEKTYYDNLCQMISTGAKHLKNYPSFIWQRGFRKAKAHIRPSFNVREMNQRSSTGFMSRGGTYSMLEEGDLYAMWNLWTKQPCGNRNGLQTHLKWFPYPNLVEINPEHLHVMVKAAAYSIHKESIHYVSATKKKMIEPMYVCAWEKMNECVWRQNMRHRDWIYIN